MATEDNDLDDLIGPVDGMEQEPAASPAGDAPTDDNAGAQGQDPSGDAGKDAKDAPAGEGDGTDASKTGAEGEEDQEGGENADKTDKGAMVPKKALDSTKRQLRETRQRLKRIEERFQAQDAAEAQRHVPDRNSDPAGFASYQAEQATMASVNQHLNFSEFQAKREHGEDTVNDAFEWANGQMDADKSGEFAKKLLSHAHPYHYAVELHKEALAAETAGSAPKAAEDPDYAAFLAWKATQNKEQQPAAQAATQQPPAKQLPTSLAQRSSASGPTGDKVTVDPFASEFDR